jgi:hypothetical protein
MRAGAERNSGFVATAVGWKKEQRTDVFETY